MRAPAHRQQLGERFASLINGLVGLDAISLLRECPLSKPSTTNSCHDKPCIVTMLTMTVICDMTLNLDDHFNQLEGIDLTNSGSKQLPWCLLTDEMNQPQYDGNLRQTLVNSILLQQQQSLEASKMQQQLQ